MRNRLQAGLIRAYQLINATGLLSTTVGEWAFRSAYTGYKRFLEAGHLRPLRPLVAPGTSVIDVGANLGFLTLEFARWVCDGGKVIAIEPETVNYGRLCRAVVKAGLTHLVDTVQAAAAETGGEVGLIVNRGHPGDHRIGDGGVRVPAVTIDGLLAAKGWPRVSLIKIDVQGSESRVLAGAEETLQALHPALFIEVCDEALRTSQSSAERLLGELYDRGYCAYRTARQGIVGPMTNSQALSETRMERYVDLLFLRGGDA
jgi:FkbM family methyltransferase